MRSVYDVNDTTNMQRVFALFYLGKSWHKLIQSRAEGGKEGASAARSGKPQKLYVEELSAVSLQLCSTQSHLIGCISKLRAPSRGRF